MSEVNKGEDFELDLDMDLDDIEDLPEFSAWPSGAYIVDVEKTPEQKEVGDHKAIEITLKCVSVEEMADKKAEESDYPKAGDITGCLFMTDNKFGAGKLKKFLVPVGVHLGKSKVAEVLAELKGMRLLIINKRTWNKDKEKFYSSVEEVSVM